MDGYISKLHTILHTYIIKLLSTGSFYPLVFSSSGGMGTAATVVYKHLASAKWNSPYSLAPVLFGVFSGLFCEMLKELTFISSVSSSPLLSILLLLRGGFLCPDP